MEFHEVNLHNSIFIRIFFIIYYYLAFLGALKPELLKKIEEIGKNRHGLLKPPPTEAQIRQEITMGEVISKRKPVLFHDLS